MWKGLVSWLQQLQQDDAAPAAAPPSSSSSSSSALLSSPSALPPPPSSSSSRVILNTTTTTTTTSSSSSSRSPSGSKSSSRRNSRHSSPQRPPSAASSAPSRNPAAAAAAVTTDLVPHHRFVSSGSGILQSHAESGAVQASAATTSSFQSLSSSSALEPTADPTGSTSFAGRPDTLGSVHPVSPSLPQPIASSTSGTTTTITTITVASPNSKRRSVIVGSPVSESINNQHIQTATSPHRASPLQSAHHPSLLQTALLRAQQSNAASVSLSTLLLDDPPDDEFVEATASPAAASPIFQQLNPLDSRFLSTESMISQVSQDDNHSKFVLAAESLEPLHFHHSGSTGPQKSPDVEVKHALPTANVVSAAPAEPHSAVPPELPLDQKQPVTAHLAEPWAAADIWGAKASEAKSDYPSPFMAPFPSPIIPLPSEPPALGNSHTGDPSVYVSPPSPRKSKPAPLSIPAPTSKDQKTPVLSDTPSKSIGKASGAKLALTSSRSSSSVSPVRRPSPTRSTRTSSPPRSALAGLPEVPPDVNPYEQVIDAMTKLRTRRYDHLNLQSANRGFYHVDDRDDSMLSDWSDRITKIKESGRGPSIQTLYALSHMRFRDPVLSRELRVISDALFRMGWSDAEYYNREALLEVLDQTVNYLEYQQAQRETLLQLQSQPGLSSPSSEDDGDDGVPFDSERVFRTLNRVRESVREESTVELDTLLVIEMMAEIAEIRRNLWGIDQIIESVEIALKGIFERYLMFVTNRVSRVYDDVPSRTRESYASSSSQYLPRPPSSLSVSRASLSFSSQSVLESPVDGYASFFPSSAGPPSASGSSLYGDNGSIRGRKGFSIGRSARSWSAGVRSWFGSRGSTPDSG